MASEQKRISPGYAQHMGFFGVHLACLAAFWTGVSPVAVMVCLALYVIRMFGITAGFHRYFAHRSFKTTRVFQFILACIGTSAAQQGPLWWAAHHRIHHRYSDQPEDPHSPILKSFLESHVGWIFRHENFATRYDQVKDLMKFPELLWLNRFHYVAPFALGTLTFILGIVLNYCFPWLGTSGFQMLVWGFFISTVLLYHGTFFINSLAHVVGSKRFNTGDESRNNLVLALITLGEGWHNNHHRYPGSERQGFYWYEIDMSHMVLTVLSWMRIVWDLRRPPQSIYDEARELALQARNAARGRLAETRPGA